MRSRRKRPLSPFSSPFPLALPGHAISPRQINMRTVDVERIKFPELLVSARLELLLTAALCFHHRNKHQAAA